MKIPLSTRAAAEAELRKRRAAAGEKAAQLGQSGIKAYCEMVTPNWNWEWPHLRYIDTFLDRVTSGEIKRLIIEMPTRIGKTEKVNVRYPAMRLEMDQELPIMMMGYNEAFAARLSRKVHRIAKTRIPMSSRQSSLDWETAKGGGIRAAGVGVGIAGLPAGLIMIDDPVKNREDAYSESHRNKVWEWFTEDVYTRLEPNGAIVITMARRHEDDLVGRILASEDAADWTVVRLPALAEEDDPLGRAPGEALCPDRFNEEQYAKMRSILGEVSFSALQQQRPTPADGLIFQADWIKYYTTPEHPIKNADGTYVFTIPSKFDEELQSWDMSFKEKTDSDPVSGQVWKRKGADCYLVDRVNTRMTFTKALTEVRKFSQRHPRIRTKLVEDKANGGAIIDSLKTEIGGFIAITPEGDKVSRAWSVTPMFEGGNVYFPHPKLCPWVKNVILQMVQFPAGTNDDDVDALSQALRRFAKSLEREQRRKDFMKRQRGSTSLILLQA